MASVHQHGSSLLEFVTHHHADLRPHTRHFALGAMLFVPHHDANCVFVIRKGRLRVSIPTEGGAQVFLAELAAGEIVGEVSAITGHRQSTIVEAIEDTDAYVFTRASFMRVLRDCPDGALEVMRTLCQRLKSINQRHIENVSLPMHARLTAELARLAAPADGGTICITRAPTHAELADKIGSQREAVTRALSDLSRRGVIRTRRRFIEILRPDALLPAADA